MKRYALIILSIITIHTHAMELEVKKEDCIPWYALYKVSAFKTLPIEVLDIIANFLTFDDFETEEEFVERTKTLEMEQPSIKYPEHLPSYKLESCSAIIASRDQRMLAYIHDQKKYSLSSDLDVMLCLIQPVLTIKNSISQKTESYSLPHYFGAYQTPIIAFNKQGTHIILHSKTHPTIQDYDDEYYGDDTVCKTIHHQKIIPLTVNTPDPHADYTKTLLKYFKQKNVFENNTKQIMLTQ